MIWHCCYKFVTTMYVRSPYKCKKTHGISSILAIHFCLGLGEISVTRVDRLIFFDGFQIVEQGTVTFCNIITFGERLWGWELGHALCLSLHRFSFPGCGGLENFDTGLTKEIIFRYVVIWSFPADGSWLWSILIIVLHVQLSLKYLREFFIDFFYIITFKMIWD